jgi:dUTP pyrophosphatase
MILKGAEGLEYKTRLSAGFDLVAAEDVVILPGDWVAVGTGLYIARATEFETLEIRPRSGLAYKYGVTVLNSPGTIDADYPDEIKVILINHGKEPFAIQAGDRIAQGVLTDYKRIENVPVKEVVRTGGFGSTGND